MNRSEYSANAALSRAAHSAPTAASPALIRARAAIAAKRRRSIFSLIFA